MINGMKSVPYKGVGKFTPKGVKAAPPIRSCNDYSTSGNKVIRSLKNEIVARAENYLATHSAKAATKMVDMLEEDGTTPHANIRMEAAKQILDRIGNVKKDQIDINMKAMHGLFILPPKEEPKESIVTPVED